MTYQFPRTIFADTTTLDNQITQIMMEACEMCRASADNEGLDRVVEEMLDTYHALETGFWIIEGLKGPGFMQTARDGVERKNRERGYYRDMT